MPGSADPFETLLDLGSSEQLILRVALHSVGGLKRWPRLDRANQGIDDLLTPMIAARRQDADLHDRTDIMSLLLTARSEDGEYLTDKEIRDDLGHLGAGRPRDDGHDVGLDDRLVAASPRRAGQSAGRSRSGRIDDGTPRR